MNKNKIIRSTIRLGVGCLIFLQGASGLAAPKNLPKDLPEDLARNPLTTILGIAPPPLKSKPGPSPTEIAVDQLVIFAMQHHPGIAGQEAKRQESALGLAKAKGVFWPEASLTAGIGQSSSESSSDSGIVTSRSRNEGWGLAVSQNLWRGGQDWLTIQQQEIALQSADMAMVQKKKTIEWRVRLAALAYNQAAMELAIGVENLKNSTEILDLSNQKVQAGQAGKIDLMQSQMQYSEAGNQIATSHMQLDKALSQLESELLLDGQGGARLSLPERLAPLRATALPGPEQELETISKTISKTTLDDSIELRLQRQTIRQREIEMQKNRRDRWLPSLDLNLSYRHNATDTRTSPATINPRPSDDTNLEARLDLRWTLWDHGKHFKVDETAAQWASLMSQELELKNKLSIDFHTTRNHLTRLGLLFKQKKSTFSQAESLYQARLQLYRAGAIDIIDLTNAATERLRSLQSLYGTLKDLQTEWYQLRALEDGISL